MCHCIHGLYFHLVQLVKKILPPTCATTCDTVDRKIFTLKIIRVKIFRVVKFSRFRLIREIFLMVDYYNMDKSIESSYRLVYYRVSGEPEIGSLVVVVDQTFIPGSVDLRLPPCKFNFRVLKFRGWLRPQNYFNSKIFPIYGIARYLWNIYILHGSLSINITNVGVPYINDIKGDALEVDSFFLPGSLLPTFLRRESQGTKLVCGRLELVILLDKFKLRTTQWEVVIRRSGETLRQWHLFLPRCR